MSSKSNVVRVSDVAVRRSAIPQLSEVASKVEKICEELHLPSINLALTYNTGKNNPYHNNTHILMTTLLAYNGAGYYGLPLNSIRNLVMAAAFHDYNYDITNPFTSITDEDRVSKSIDAFLAYMDTERNCGREYSLCKTEIEILIRSTQFPYKNHKVPSCEQRILRDADLMSVLAPNWEKLIEGLRREREISLRKKILKTEWADTQYKFWTDVIFNTDWALELVYPADLVAYWNKRKSGTRTKSSERLVEIINNRLFDSLLKVLDQT